MKHRVLTARVGLQEVVASLAEGYRGFAQMTNLVSHWLILAGKKPAEVCIRE